MDLIELRNVTKVYAGQTRVAVDHVSLRIETGRTTVLIGPSGCGKSSLLRIMLGLVQPDSGEVVLDGNALTDRQIPSLRTRTGYVIQDGGLFPHMTARANITLMARQRDWDARQIDDRVVELVDLTRFPSEGLDRYPVELSGGQRQRVALMRALMLKPDLLLLDEPLGALDPMIRFDLQTDLQAIFEQLDTTVVLVTHDLAEAAHFADRIVLMRGGRIVQSGPLADLLDRPADPFVTQFVTAQRGQSLEVSQ